jgi:uncharacterized delta-60 repeat protein
MRARNGGFVVPITEKADRQNRPAYALEALEQRYFLSAGYADPAFGQGGFVIDDRFTPDGYMQVLVQSDGKVVVAGDDQNGSLFVARYKADGSIDNSFSDDGMVELPAWSLCEITLQPDGMILLDAQDLLVGGTRLARLKVDGSMDNDFGEGGVVEPEGWVDDRIRLLQNGKILLIGDGELQRLNQDGSPDLTFGDQSNLEMDGRIDELGEQPGGNLVVIIGPYGDFDDYYHLKRFSPDGEIDWDFGDEGAVDVPDDRSGFENMVVTKQGEILVLTNGSDPLTLFGYDSDGRPQTEFGPNGMKIGFGLDQYGTDVVVQPDGKLVLGWYPELAAARLNSDGTIDDSFGEGGISQLGLIVDDGWVAPAMGNDGRLVLAGMYIEADGRQELMLARLTNDGDPTPTPSSKAIQSPAELAAIERRRKAESAQDNEESQSDCAILGDDSSDVLDGDGDTSVWDE